MSRELGDYLISNYSRLSQVVVTNRKGKQVKALNAANTLALAYFVADRANSEALFWYGQRAIGDYLCIHQREVQEHLSKLVQAGWIEKVGRRSYNGGQPSDLYLVTFGKPRDGYLPTPETGTKTGLETGSETGSETGLVLSEPETETKSPNPTFLTGEARKTGLGDMKKEQSRTSPHLLEQCSDLVRGCITEELTNPRHRLREPDRGGFVPSLVKKYKLLERQAPSHLSLADQVQYLVAMRHGETIPTKKTARTSTTSESAQPYVGHPDDIKANTPQCEVVQPCQPQPPDAVPRETWINKPGALATLLANAYKERDKKRAETHTEPGRGQ